MQDDDNCYDLMLLRLSAKINNYYKMMLKPAGITPGQYRILRHIDHIDGGSVQTVADSMGVDRSTLARTVKPLINSGLIEDNNAAGCRDRSLVLTVRGKKTMKQAVKCWLKAQEHISQTLGDEGIAKLSEIIELLSDI